jgi:uncharacterized protein YdiU (UPF0061 family)
LVETGEQLARNDEPSPTRSSVLVRLSHSHVRFGTFERLAALDDADAIAELVAYCVRYLHPSAQRADTAQSAAALLRESVAATADMAASWMAAGFVHGVLNTDNMVVTGESFDYGPWRFLPRSEPGFTAAYFDAQGLYAFGRQPARALWNLNQLANCLTLVCGAAPLEGALAHYGADYRTAFRRRVFAVLGVDAADEGEDLAFLKALFAWMTTSGASWPQVFFDWFGGGASETRAFSGPLAPLYRSEAFSGLRASMLARQPERPERLTHPYFAAESPPDLLIDTVEALWAHIAENDDWAPLTSHLERIDQARQALDLRPARSRGA